MERSELYKLLNDLLLMLPFWEDIVMEFSFSLSFPFSQEKVLSEECLQCWEVVWQILPSDDADTGDN